MRRLSYLLILTLTVLSSTSLFAADSPAKPPAGFTFNGKWDCSGNIPGHAKAHRAGYEGRTVSDGTWVELSYVDIDPAGYSATFLIGWDVNKKQIVTFVADNKGYGTFTGQGWQGRSLVLTRNGPASFEGFTDATIPLTRVTLEFKSSDVFTTSWEIKNGPNWEVDDFLSCKLSKM